MSIPLAFLPASLLLYRMRYDIPEHKICRDTLRSHNVSPILLVFSAEDAHSAVPDTRYTLRFHSLPVHPGFLQPGPVKDHTVYFVLGLYMRKHTNLNIQV